MNVYNEQQGFTAGDMADQAAAAFERGRESVLAERAAAAQEAVAYLDIGAGGYLDIGSDLPEEQLLALPNGRHALGIIGTYGIDGYVSAPVTAAPVDLDALAVNRYRPVPDGLLAYKVVAGDGTRSLFSGTMNECNVVARKLTEAFLDGAHVASTPAAPGIDLAGLRAIAGDLSQSAKVDDYEPHQIAFIESIRDRLLALIDASHKGAYHPDDAAVDAFASAMKAKLADARAKGRSGWNGDDPGMQQRLSDMLRAHVEKGDPRDVANFCMFLHQRGEGISPKGGSEARAAEAMADEYQKWIDFYHRGDGDYGDFLRREIFPVETDGKAQASDAEVRP